MRPNVVALSVAVAAVVVALIGGPAAADTTTTSRPTTSTTLTTTTTTTTPPPVEVPADEAALISLIDNVRSRLSDLATTVAAITARIAANQSALDAADLVLYDAQSTASAGDAKLQQLTSDATTARAVLRDRAVAAYMHQPTSDVVNIFARVANATELVDAQGVYRSIIDHQLDAVRRYQGLVHAATSTAAAAHKARDSASRQQTDVANQQQQLQALRQTLQQIEQASADQEAQQTRLLSQFGQNKTSFEQELAAQAAESANIARLLQSVSAPGDSAPAPTGGYFADPIPGASVTQRFGPNSDPFTGAPGFHPGIDFGAKMGTSIRAAGDGTVVFAGQESGYGSYTCINHGRNVATCYGHQSVILVHLGDVVTRGQLIGLVGTTGYSTGPHLHFEVRVGGTPVDPLAWISLS